MYVLNGFSLAVCPRRWPRAPAAPQQPLLLIHPECKSLHLPTASSQGVPLLPSAASSLICVGFQAGFDAQTQTCPRTLALLRKATLLGLSPGVNPVTPAPAELGEGAWGGLGADEPTGWIRESKGARKVWRRVDTT